MNWASPPGCVAESSIRVRGESTKCSRGERPAEPARARRATASTSALPRSRSRSPPPNRPRRASDRAELSPASGRARNPPGGLPPGGRRSRLLAYRHATHRHLKRRSPRNPGDTGSFAEPSRVESAAMDSPDVLRFAVVAVVTRRGCRHRARGARVRGAVPPRRPCAGWACDRARRRRDATSSRSRPGPAACCCNSTSSCATATTNSASRSRSSASSGRVDSRTPCSRPARR